MDRTESLVQSLFVYASDSFGKRHVAASDDETLAFARHLAGYPPRDWHRADWDASDWTAGHELLRRGAVGTTKRLQARVVGVRDVRMHRVRPGSTAANYATGRVADLVATDGTALPSLPITDESIAAVIEDRLAAVHPLDLFVLVLALPLTPGDRSRTFVVHIVGARAADRALVTVQATAAERADAERAIRAMNKTPPWQAIATRAMDAFGVERTDGDVQTLACRAAVLAALSCGESNGFSMKISTAVFGPPGRGKSFSGKILGALASRCAKADAPTLTLAGLAGGTPKAGEDPRQSIGVAEAARDGAAIIEDAHAIETRPARPVFTLMASVMDTGMVRSGKFRGGSFHAPVSFHVDANLDAQLGRTPPARERATRITSWRPLLSRWDVLLYAAPSSDDSRKLARRIARAAGRRRASPDVLRALAVQVAWLRDRHPEISLSGAAAALDRCAGRIEHWFDTHKGAIPDPDDLYARLVTSLKRLTMAIARGCNRSAAKASDVREAWVFVEAKLESLAALERAEREADDARERAKHRDLRVETVRGMLEKEPQTLVALRRAVAKATGQSLYDTQLLRAVEAAGGVRRSRGVYALNLTKLTKMDSSADFATRRVSKSAAKRPRRSGRPRRGNRHENNC